MAFNSDMYDVEKY